MMSTLNTRKILRKFFIDTKLLFLMLFIGINSLFGQRTSVNFDYLTVDERPREPIGFLGTGVSIFHPSLPVYAGIRLNNAAWGSRAGYYTFGYHTGAILPLSNSISLQTRLMFTSGGGAESNDGSGWFISPAVTLNKSFGSYNMGVGAQYSYVSTGVIQGASAYFTINKDIDFNIPFEKASTVQLFTNTVWSPTNERGSGIGFIGIGGRNFHTYTYESVYLTAAVTDLGGYMDVYGGKGIWKQAGPLRFLVEANLGTGGGGRAPAGGGILYGAGGEVQLHHANMFIGSSGGILKSFDGPFYFSFLGLHLGTELSYNSKNSSQPQFILANLCIENSIRTYLGPSGFSNLGVAFQLFKKRWISLRGESYWAFTDGRGAYAEGLFGLRIQPGWAYVEGQLGAGAGGGINLWNGAGLAFVNAGVDVPLSPSMSVNPKFVYNVFSTTPFPRYGIQLGLTCKIPFKMH